MMQTHESIKKYVSWQAAHEYLFDSQGNHMLLGAQGKTTGFDFDLHSLQIHLCSPMEACGGSHQFIIALRKAHLQYRRCWELLQNHLRRRRAADCKAKHHSSAPAAKLCKSLKGSFQPPLERLGECTSDGATRVVTKPLDVDRVAQAAWNPIFDGNLSPVAARVTWDAFHANYGHLLLQQAEFVLPELDPQELRNAILESADNAIGLDGWSKTDLELLTLKALDWLILMFPAI